MVLPSSREVPPTDIPNKASHSVTDLVEMMNSQIVGIQSAFVTWGCCRISRRNKKIMKMIVKKLASGEGI